MKSKRLIIIALCGMAACSLGIGMNSQGVFFSPLAERMGTGRGAIAMYNTISALTTAIGTLILSRILNSGNLKAFIHGSTAVAALAMTVMGFSQSLGLLYAAAFAMGASFSVFAPAIISIILNDSVDRNVGFYTGIIFSFSGIIGAICSPLFSFIISNSGITQAYMTMAAVFVIMSLPANLLPLSYPQRNNKTKGENAVSWDAVLCMTVLLFTLFQILPAMVQHFTGYAVTRGVEASIGSMMVSAAMIGNISFKLVSGWMSDKFGVFATSVIMIILCISSAVALLLGSGTFLLMFSAFGYGTIYAITSVITPLVTKAIYPGNEYNTIYPVITFTGAAVNAFATSLIGYSYDFTGSYDLALYIILGIQVVSTVMLLEVQRRRKF